ncbi:MAG: tetratricopeptide repeat protein [Candidatus Hydrogenedentes bacterium]|nr:tetratricopeptide repeat protein [Candidatus Hydrogenedentota bacterium]
MSTHAGTRTLITSALIVFALSLLLNACGGAGKSQELKDADTYLSLGKTKEAAELYAKARVADPSDATALVGLGKCLAVEGKLEEALKQFQQVIKESPATEEAFWQASDVLTLLGRDNEALDLAKQCVSVSPEPATLLQGQVLLLSGKPSEAVSVLGAAAEQPGNSSARQILMALAQSAQGDPSVAEKNLREMLQDQSVATAARAALIDIKFGDAVATSLVEETETVAKVQSGDDDAQSTLSLAYAAAGQIDKAESLAREITMRSPGSGWANYALGRCMLAKGDAKQAVEPLRKAALILPREYIVRRDYTAARKGQTSAGQAVAAQATDKAPDGPKSDTAKEPEWQSLWKRASLTRLLRDRDRFLLEGGENLRETLVAAAVFQNNLDLADQLAAELPDDSPLRLFIAAHRKGDPDAVIEALNPWLNRKDALEVIGRNALAFSMSAAGVRARALQVLWACRSNFPDDGVSLLNSAMTFRQAGMPKFAAKSLEQLIAQYPDSYEAYILQGIALRESGDRDEALRAAQVASASFPDDSEIVLNLSQACLDARQPKEAEDNLTRALGAKPDDQKLISALALVHLHTGKPQDALSLLEKLPATAEDREGSALLHALALAATANWKLAGEKARALETGGAMPIGSVLAAACALKTNDRDAAIASLESISDKKHPVVNWATTAMLRSLGKQSDESSNEDFDALVKTLGQSNTSLADFAYGTAFSWAGLPDEAFVAFSRIEKDAPETTNALLPVLFDNLSKSVQIADPVDPVKEVVNRHQNAKQAWLGAARTYKARRLTQEQEVFLNKAAEVAPSDPGVFVERGMFYENTRKLYTAMDEYRKALALDAANPIALNNLAYCIISTKGDPKEARDLAQKALTTLRNDTNVMHTLGVALLRIGELAESQKHLEKALERSPGEPTIMLDFGLNLIEQGKVQEGRRQVEAAVRFSEIFGLEFPRLAEAEDVLEKYPAEKPAALNEKAV